MLEMADLSAGRGTHTAGGYAGRTIRPGPFALWATMLVVAVGAEGFIFANRSTWSSPSDAVGIGTIFALTYGVAGMLIVSRHPENTVGRIFLYLTAVMAITEFCGEYA